ncbi:hypothetical protein AVEN_263285-1 [Araneus ventricosus]|uniref:Uncharacterized protein n=1 Tax=Araneus ventricosus TaxID=182803 RepID=A0A4Y2HHL6_ARAVE|nr:hypothetical protein AVEN_263285-1 [Araneus ventricosus]
MLFNDSQWYGANLVTSERYRISERQNRALLEDSRNFEPLSDDENNNGTGNPSPSFRITQADWQLTLMDLMCSMPMCTADLSAICRPIDLETEALSPSYYNSFRFFDIHKQN